jgi:uncharacterized protein YutE (UPF0331/DUF86 family)
VLDRDLVQRKLSDLEQYIAQVSEYRNISTEESRGDWRSLRIIDRDLRDAMVNMARFRNVIVHEYARIDPDVVVQILQHHLDDLTRFPHDGSGLAVTGVLSNTRRIPSCGN